MTRDDFQGRGRQPLLVSACLLGVYCRYDGRMETDGRVADLASRFTLIPVCPEQLGGLPTPRDAVELSGDKALTRSGADMTEAFTRGVEQVLLGHIVLGYQGEPSGPVEAEEAADKIDGNPRQRCRTVENDDKGQCETDEEEGFVAVDVAFTQLLQIAEGNVGDHQQPHGHGDAGRRQRGQTPSGHNGGDQQKPRRRDGKPLKGAVNVLNVETGQPQGSAEGEEGGNERSRDAVPPLKVAGIKDQSRCNAEADDIGQAVQFDAEGTAASDAAGDLAVHEIEKDGHEDEPGPEAGFAVKHQDKGQHAAEDVAAGDHVGDDLLERQRYSPVSVHLFTTPITVSPALTFCPTTTAGRTETGR